MQYNKNPTSTYFLCFCVFFERCKDCVDYFWNNPSRVPSMGFDARPDLACLVLNYKRFHALNSGFFV